MICKYYGKTYSVQTLREQCAISREGVSLLGISTAAEKLGFRTIGVHLTFEHFLKDAPLPCIVHWKQNHFVVVYHLPNPSKGGAKHSSPFGGGREGAVCVADPAAGLIKYTAEEFKQCWLSRKSDGKDEGIALLLEPTPDFYAAEDEKPNKTKFSFILQYLTPYKKLLFQLFLGMLLGTLLQLLFPFLTQSIVDYGIGNNNLGFITLILIAQLTLYIAQTAVEFIRSWILLHISTRINISIISDFLIKLMKLPLRFFDTKMLGDIMQRIGDHRRIETFLTSATINTLFSMLNFMIFTCILAFYNVKLLLIFLLASVLYALWIVLFLRKRKELDYKRFAMAASEQSNLYQLITGMQEIKLNNSEKQHRWQWENIQAKLFKISIKGLALSQYQQTGAFFINETKNIIISYFAAYSVLNGEMTLGMMMAVQYIIGQLNSPINQMIGFIQSAQDAKISLERLGEIHGKEDEESSEDHKITIFPDDKSLYINNLTFHYDILSASVLQELNLRIEEGKVTAIVGMSGSGKTTLVKMLMGFYPPNKGEIRVGSVNLENLSSKMWREKIGAVMQDGFIFSESIAKNIAVGEYDVDVERLFKAAKMANINEMVEKLPLGYNTRIGQEGNGISQGQKQRILIARAVYKNPDYIFLDEATNALDANNEKVIMENLNAFFKGKTVVVVAHRLSTVKNADKIVVLNNGQISEMGTHSELAARRGEYYELVKNQLEMD
jgi:ATP-binding cassette subfamily B protein